MSKRNSGKTSKKHKKRTVVKQSTTETVRTSANAGHILPEVRPLSVSDSTKSADYGVKIIISVLTLFFLFSIASNQISLPFTGQTIKLKPLQGLFTFSIPVNNKLASGLIASYTDTSSGGNSLLPQDSLFFNPVYNGQFALDKFFSALTNEAPKQVIRIAHYGDSQLEGDRISSQLREKLQKKYGGSGYGYVPLADIANSISYDRTNSENLQKFNVFSLRLHGNEPYGISGAAFRFVYQITHSNPNSPDTLQADSTGTTEQPQDTVLRFTSGSVVYHFKSNNKFSSAFLTFGKVMGPTLLTIKGDNGLTLFSGNIANSPEFSSEVLNRLELPADKMQTSLSITMSGDNKTLFYGLYLDGDKFVQVDNYSIRGHSGDGLSLINTNLASAQTQHLNTRLVILQYGGNIVPYMTDKKKQYIKDIYSSVIRKIKELYPQASVMLVGVGDMATSYNGTYRTYSGLPAVRDALREVALENHCAFFDLFKLMGGENSILTWAEKGLAAKDGHFGPAGEAIVAGELVKIIDKEFTSFKTRNMDAK